jgi:hypothetical protein
VRTPSPNPMPTKTTRRPPTAGSPRAPSASSGRSSSSRSNHVTACSKSDAARSRRVARVFLFTSPPAKLRCESFARRCRGSSKRTASRSPSYGRRDGDRATACVWRRVASPALLDESVVHLVTLSPRRVVTPSRCHLVTSSLCSAGSFQPFLARWSCHRVLARFLQEPGKMPEAS